MSDLMVYDSEANERFLAPSDPIDRCTRELRLEIRIRRSDLVARQKVFDVIRGGGLILARLLAIESVPLLSIK